MPGVHLPRSSPEPLWSRTTSNARKYIRRSNKAVMRSYHFQIPVYDLPVRLRPWFLIFTSLTMVMLAFLGFTNVSHGLPLNDKLLHFFCLMLATGVFYFIFDVEEDARRVWFWRQAPLIFTGVVCFLFGGILSEYVQSMIPLKEFQFGDVVANLLGSSFGLYAAYYLEKYYRHRREIARLYRPLGMSSDSLQSDDEDDFEPATQLLPTHFDNPRHQPPQGVGSKPPPQKSVRLADVWDEREELFDIGGDSDDEGDYTPLFPRSLHPTATIRDASDRALPPTPPGPEIIVTSPMRSSEGLGV